MFLKCSSPTIIQNWILVLTIIVSTFSAFWINRNSNINLKKDRLNSILLEIQRLSFSDPFVEDNSYTRQWNKLKDDYQNNRLPEQQKHKLLKYDVYTEMIYNYMELALKVYKTEKELLEYVDFKSWVSTHALNWKNPLKENSNQEVYSKYMCKMIDKWLK